MNRHQGLERELTVWLADVATPRVPDYTNDIVQLTAGLRQRPRWTFLERWLPMSVEPLRRVPVRPVPWRAIGLLVLLALTVAAYVAITAGSQPRLPAPFGVVAAGAVAYDVDGDVWIVDPSTGIRSTISIGPSLDHDPRWSLDGTRLAFVRESADGGQIIIVEPEGTGPLVIASRALTIDPDGIKWSPDGRSILLSADGGDATNLFLVDTDNGQVTMLPISDRAYLEASWRPPSGHEILYLGGPLNAPRLQLFSMEDASVRPIPLTPREGEELRPMGWSADGRQLVVHHVASDGQRFVTSLVDVDTGEVVDYDVAFGHLSHDGTRIVGLAGVNGGDGLDALCVVDVGGDDACHPVGVGLAPPEGTGGEGIQWSPDDRWIVSQPNGGGRAVLIDPTGESPEQPAWINRGAESWQRAAP
jgi:WD40-like Beta Propeller Repeat